MDDFTLTAFAPGDGSPRVGRGSLTFGRLRVVLHDGTTFDLALADVSVRLGGASGTMLFVTCGTTGVTVAVDVPGFPGALRAAAGGALDEPLRRFGAAVRGRRRWDLVLGGVVVALAAAFAALVVALPRYLAGSVGSLPTSVDTSIGDAVYDQLAPPDRQVHDPAIDAAVAAVLARLEPYARQRGFTLAVRVVRESDVNAFALPGGRIVLNAGLLAEAERPELVAAVLAHEIAHVTERHGVEKLVASLGVRYGISLLAGQVDFLPAYAADGAMVAALASFSRGEEAEADAVGATILGEAHLDPGALIDVFRMLSAQPGSEMPGMVAFLSSHPGHQDRIAALRGVRAPATVEPLPIEDWPAVRAAARAAVRP